MMSDAMAGEKCMVEYILFLRLYLLLGLVLRVGGVGGKDPALLGDVSEDWRIEIKKKCVWLRLEGRR